MTWIICWRLQQEGWTIGFSPAAMVWHHRVILSGPIGNSSRGTQGRSTAEQNGRKNTTCLVICPGPDASMGREYAGVQVAAGRTIKAPGAVPSFNPSMNRPESLEFPAADA